jgi:hypothetical protein
MNPNGSGARKETDPMLRWLFLVAGIAALAIMFAVGSQIAIILAFGIVFGNFATLCIQFNGPVDRARARMRSQLVGLQWNSDAHQRMDTATIAVTPADRAHPMNTMTMLNIASGVACFAMLAWGIILWVT